MVFVYGTRGVILVVIDFRVCFMIRLIITGAALLSIAACASSAPETAEPAVQNTAATGSEVATNSASASDSPVDVVDIPKDEVVVADAVMEELVCTRSRETGSMRITKVCRSRRQIAQERAAAKKVLDRNEAQRSVVVGGE